MLRRLSRVAKAFWVGAGHVYGHDVGAVRNGLDAKSRVFGQYLENAFRLAPGGLVFIQEIVDEFQGHCGVRPGTGQATAEHAAHMEQVLGERPRASQNGPGSSIEALVQRHVHGIEQRGVLRRRDAGVSGFHEQAGAVEVQPDAFLPGEGGDAPHFVIAEHGVVHAPYRRLNANDADIRLYPAGAAAPHRVLHLR